MNIIKHIVFNILISMAFVNSIASQEIYITQPLSDNIKSLQLSSTGNSYLLPIIELSSNDKIAVKFDNLDIAQPRLRYKIVHCNFDWTISDINEIDYLNGFNDNRIDNYNYSNNTHINYVNYNLELPNEYVGFKISGNYLLIIYDEYTPNINLLTACFSVVDSKVGIDASTTGNTDIDFNREHQQLSFVVNHKDLHIQYPEKDIKVVVRQNMRFDNRVDDIKPSYIYPDKLVYEHNRSLIFEAGNEYRRFEIVNKQYGGLNVSKVEYINPYFNAWLVTDDVRANRARHYDKDQNGKYLIRGDRPYDNDVSEDYFLVHFTLDANLLASHRDSDKIWLDGEFTYSKFRTPLEYDASNNIYHTSVLLKQGAYNYQYLSESYGVKSTSSIEGNYFDTDNSYSIYVYHRSSGTRYDKLIGFIQISS